MNRNLHSPTKLTEFVREFDEEEPTTYFSQFVNKITSAYNNGYNTMNIVPLAVPAGQAADSPSEVMPPPPPSPLFSSSPLSTPSPNEPIYSPSAAAQEGASSQIDSIVSESEMLNLERSPSGVMNRVRNLMAVRNDVKATIRCSK